MKEVTEVTLPVLVRVDFDARSAAITIATPVIAVTTAMTIARLGILLLIKVRLTSR